MTLDIFKLLFEIAELIGRIAFAVFGVVIMWFLSAEMLGLKRKGKKNK